MDFHRFLPLRDRGFDRQADPAMSYMDLLKHQLVIDEARRRFPYVDSVGKITIGIGRDLNDVGLRDDEIDLMFSNDIAEAERTARALLPDFDDLSDVRKMVVCDMSFNLGYTRLSLFKNFLLAVHEQRWSDAADEMMNSRWSTQVGDRAKRLAQAMETDSL